MIDDTLYDAFGQRQVSTMFTQLNQYRVVLEVDAGVPAAIREDLDEHLRALGRPAAQVPLGAFTQIEHDERAAGRSTIRDSSRSSTLSFNLAPGASLGEAVDAIDAGRSESSACRPASRPSFQGTAQAFQASLANEPLLILAALVTVYIVLGVLYESYIHPITILSTLPSAGVGRAARAACSAGTDLSVIALIGIILLIGIVKKNAIMMIDFALEAERKEGKPPRRGDLPGVPAALPADHDDDDGGAARRRAAGARHAASGSELRRPLGIAIVGGLIVSQVLTLYTTPVIYLCVRPAGAARSRRRTAPRASRRSCCRRSAA